MFSKIAVALVSLLLLNEPKVVMQTYYARLSIVNPSKRYVEATISCGPNDEQKVTLSPHTTTDVTIELTKLPATDDACKIIDWKIQR